jgi:superfamily II DNA or RNA helicase
MGMLMNASLERVYRSSHHQLGRDFLARLIVESKLYRRAAGYFSSSSYRVAPLSFKRFFEGGGRVSLVCSPVVSNTDLEAMISGVFFRKTAKSAFTLDSITEEMTQKQACDLLSWLLASQLLQVKIALVANARGHEIYHEKIGILSDEAGEMVAFTGSANETRSAYMTNFERVDAFSTFGDDADRRRAFGIDQQFRALWSNETSGVEVIPLDVALQRSIMRISPEGDHLHSSGSSSRALATRVPPETLFPAPDKPIRPHQEAAIKAWARQGGRGILEMATGSGKTVTALTLGAQLYENMGSGLAVVIVAPFIHLVDQWKEVAHQFGLNPIRCADSRNDWYDEMSVGVSALNLGRRPLLSIVVTAATLASSDFQKLLTGIRKPMLFIGDEVHNYGSPSTSLALPQNATYRLGLSATPERAFDPEGTKRIGDFFGPSVFKYDLAAARRDGILVPYRYLPEVITLSSEETDRYLELTGQIGRFGGEPEGEPPDSLKRLLIKRARVVAGAAAKLPLLRRLLSSDRDQTHLLVYCGDGTVEGAEPQEITRQVDEAVRIIGSELKMRCASYTAATKPARRIQLLRDFASGEIQVLVAIRCLDEGVDVPATRRAVMLASSLNPRQFVQRRGRVLRTFPGKERAEIVDVFVTIPPERFARGEKGFSAARGLLKSQLVRAREFADLAENGQIARDRLLALRDHFDLLAEG